MHAPRSLIRLAAVGLVVASMAACTQRPPADPGVPPGPTTGPTQPQNPGVPPGPVNPDRIPGAVTPGSVQDFVVNVGDRVYFDFDSYSVRHDAMPRLDNQARWLAQYSNVRVRIEGNADERGTREYNLALGARRAEAVRNYLISRGVSASRIETISFGKERPIALGSTEEAWAQNRNAHTAIASGAQ